MGRRAFLSGCTSHRSLGICSNCCWYVDKKRPSKSSWWVPFLPHRWSATQLWSVPICLWWGHVTPAMLIRTTNWIRTTCVQNLTSYPLVCWKQIWNWDGSDSEIMVTLSMVATGMLFCISPNANIAPWSPPWSSTLSLHSSDISVSLSLVVAHCRHFILRIVAYSTCRLLSCSNVLLSLVDVAVETSRNWIF